MILGPVTQEALKKAIMAKFGQVAVTDPEVFIRETDWADYREYLEKNPELVVQLIDMSDGCLKLKKSVKILKQNDDGCPVCKKQARFMTSEDMRYMISHKKCENCFILRKGVI